MKNTSILILLILFKMSACKKQAVSDLETNQKSVQIKKSQQRRAPLVPTSTPTVPHVPDHIIFVWFENKGYSSIVGNSSAPYLNSLAQKGTLFTNTYGLSHPSYPNYIRFFSGRYHRIMSDNCISGKPLSAPTMYNALKDAGASFKWYSEGLPYAGSDTCNFGYYREKHNPTTIFSSVPSAVNQPVTSMNLDDTSKYKYLPSVACVSPNMMNDMHDGTIAQGDAWFKNNFSNLINWSLTHNSVVVVYFDESESAGDNRIPVIAVGQYVAANYKSAEKYDHYNWTKTICAMFGADNNWTSNLVARTLITGCWL